MGLSDRDYMRHPPPRSARVPAKPLGSLANRLAKAKFALWLGWRAIRATWRRR